MKSSLVLVILSAILTAQEKPVEAAHDGFASLHFLEGTWGAKAQGSSVATASGDYAFKLELGAHILARHSRTANCQAPAGYDCEHGDLLYIYEDEPGKPLKAIYFDSEGHVIHYEVSVPAPNTALLVSDSAKPGPQFRLVYELKQGVMSGKFQMHMPGQPDWKSYLEWSGNRQP